MIKQIIFWVFAEINFLILLKIDSQIIFEVLFLLFNGKSKDLLQEEDEDFFKYFIEEDKVSITKFHQNLFFEKILEIIFNCSLNNDELDPFFVQFIANVTGMSLFIPVNLCLKSILFLIKFPCVFELNKEEINSFQYNEKSNNLIFIFLKKCENSLDQKNLENILFYADKSPL